MSRAKDWRVFRNWFGIHTYTLETSSNANVGVRLLWRLGNMQRDYKVLHNAPSGKNDITTRHTVRTHISTWFTRRFCRSILFETIPRDLVEPPPLSSTPLLPRFLLLFFFRIPFRLSIFRSTFCLIRHLINTLVWPLVRSCLSSQKESISCGTVLRSIVTDTCSIILDRENRVNIKTKLERLNVRVLNWEYSIWTSEKIWIIFTTNMNSSSFLPRSSYSQS